jgi:hypothetical protein
MKPVVARQLEKQIEEGRAEVKAQKTELMPEVLPKWDPVFLLP